MNNPGDRTFKRITNNDIYKEIVEMKEHIIKQNGSIALHRKWLYGLSMILMAFLGWALAF